MTPPEEIAPPRQVFVHQAELDLNEGDHPDDPGAAITVALCGMYAHDPPCHWPHHTAAIVLRSGERHAQLRTVFAAPPRDELEVRGYIDAALRVSWTVHDSGADALREDERDLGDRLLRHI